MKKPAIIAATALVLLAGCGSYNDKRGFGDAPVGKVSDRPWDIQNAPNEYGNIATVCLEHAPGWRAFHVTAEVQPIIVRDEACK